MVEAFFGFAYYHHILFSDERIIFAVKKSVSNNAFLLALLETDPLLLNMPIDV